MTDTFAYRLGAFRSLVAAVKKAQCAEMTAADTFMLKMQMDATCAAWKARTRKQKLRLWEAVKRWAVTP